MLTVRQIQRHWDSGEFDRITTLCMEMRPERSGQLLRQFAGSSLCASAMAVIRLSELNQAYVSLCARLIRHILAAQQPDGGWGDPLPTALCLRALMCGNGAGPAIDAGIQYLADLQKTDGIWPKVPIRRMSADPYVSAFILFCLADDERFRRTVRIDDALKWFQNNHPVLDPDTLRLWQIISSRHPMVILRNEPNSKPVSNLATETYKTSSWKSNPTEPNLSHLWS